MAWNTGEDELRTALYVEETVDGVHHATVLLSNGNLTCGLPAESDPQEQQQALLDLLTAACRENARHVILHLYRDESRTDWLGDYDGRDAVHPSQISEGRPRLFSAAYYGIEEAALVQIEGFERTYTATEAQLEEEAGTDGDVLVTASGTAITAQFSLPAANVSGRFRATPCGDDTSLFDLLEASPLYVCP